MQKVAVIAGASLFVGGIFLYQVVRLYHFKKIAEIEKKKEEVSKKFIDDSIARRRMAVLCTNPSLQSFFLQLKSIHTILLKFLSRIFFQNFK
jgi:hypothetical protein